jgi:hypothetical protein
MSQGSGQVHNVKRPRKQRNEGSKLRHPPATSSSRRILEVLLSLEPTHTNLVGGLVWRRCHLLRFGCRLIKIRTLFGSHTDHDVERSKELILVGFVHRSVADQAHFPIGCILLHRNVYHGQSISRGYTAGIMRVNMNCWRGHAPGYGQGSTMGLHFCFSSAAGRVLAGVPMILTIRKQTRATRAHVQ